MLELLRIHKALADETRLRLARILLAHEMNVGELVGVLGMGQPRISRHLKILVEAGLVDCRREGQWAFYRAAAAGPGRAVLECSAGLWGAAPAGETSQDLVRAQAAVRERVQAARRFFDSVAGSWQALQREVLGGFDLGAEILRRVPEGASAADLGCGPGELLERLSGRACLAIGVDNAPRMLELAGQRLAGRGNVSLRLGDLAHLPLREGEVQVAVFSLVLHHLPDPAAALAEARRVLAPGGALLVADLDRHENEALREHPGARLGLDRADLDRWLVQAGFAPGRVAAFPVNRGLTLVLAEARKGDAGA